MMARRLEHDWFDRPLPPNVVLGERSWLYSSFAFLHYHSRRPVGLRVGHDTGLYNGTFFDLGVDGEVEIGCYCTLVGAIIASNARVVVGDYVFMAHEVVIADSFAATPLPPPPCGPPSHAVDAAFDGPGYDTPIVEVGDDVWIGARAVLLGGAHIGAGSIVGAAAVVDRRIPPHSIVAGNPAVVVGQVPSGRADHHR